MNKTELLADLANKVLRVISTAVQPDPAKESAGINTYATNVLDFNDGTPTGRTIGWYVLDEGTPQEAAYYKDTVATPMPFYFDALGYLNGLGYHKFKVTERHVELGYALADVWEENTDGTLTKKAVMIYYTPEGTQGHKEIV